MTCRHWHPARWRLIEQGDAGASAAASGQKVRNRAQFPVLRELSRRAVPMTRRALGRCQRGGNASAGLASRTSLLECDG
jgi:hypothetical protein